jgi:hypothetical protein
MYRWLKISNFPDSDPGCYLLYTLQFEFDLYSFVMNDSEIALKGMDNCGDRYVAVLKFAKISFAERQSSNLKENPEAKNIKMKVIFDGDYTLCSSDSK